MNKLLIGTAAAALFTVPAVAGPIAVTVGGYYNSMIYNVDSDNTGKDYKDISLQEDAEIIFKGKGKSSSGVEYGFQVQLEAHSSENADGDKPGDQIDEHYIYVKGDFGKIELGAENSAAYKLQVAAPKFLGWKTYDNNFATWSKVAKFEKPLHDNYSGDANKINYYTPSMNGLQIGVAFTPSSEYTSGNGMTLLEENTSKHQDTTSIGLRYKGKMGGSKVAFSYTIEDSEKNSEDYEETAIGFSIKNGAWTIGGNQFESDEADSNHWDVTHVGVAYKMSKATTLGFAIHQQEDDKATNDNNDTDITIIGGNTKLSKGVKLTYSYEQVESDNASKGDSEFLGVGLLLKF